MTYNAQQQTQYQFEGESNHPNYLVSKPNALLAKVENCMSNAFESDAIMQLDNANIVREAAQYHLSSGGQRLRARLALSAGQAIGLSDQDSVLIASAVELLHNASLIHDDLQDGDQFRRGQESIWSKYGNSIAICCGDLYLSTAYGVISQVSQAALIPQLIQLMHQRIAKAVYGQCADLTINPDQITLATYIEIVKAKSGALLSLPLELVLVLGGQSQGLPLAQAACNDFAVGFQIFDDLRDVTSDSAHTTASQLSDRLNIVSVFEYLNRDLDISCDAIVASKEMAIQHFQSAKEVLSQLPAQSGLLLEECTLNLRSLINELN
ncbi:Geranylgeranyl pyrophosphate synthase [Polynucleobacter meluiroseus]|uniref:Geranylgeranyl pyrophosphate synthase n=1 Tax=Polynucleobacter meluiroseus TaxID=1938814 RepID=A0A240DZ65_9BURK|nr:polyprenyl synthetase family protein [Polynucleobacter meluiroseus]SNX27910.1 Geranylgeranyl pyrophosphate synthase [Polynucleobacter meluiroseus]